MTGHNSIRMEALVGLYKNLGFSDAETYIQSGNVVFNLTDDTASGFAATRIEEAILKEWGFRIPVIIRTAEEVAQVIKSNPFLKK